MSDGATIPVKFISDEKALATMEKRLETVTNRLDQMAAAGKRAGQVDPFAKQQQRQQQSSIDRWQAANTRSMTANERIAQAPAIMQTRNVISQVRAQQAAREAAKQHADELAKQPTAWDATEGALMRYAGGVAIATLALKGALAVTNAIGDANQKWAQDLSVLDRRLEIMQAKVVLQAGAKGDKGAQETIRTAAEAAKAMPAMGDKLEEYVNAQVYLEGSDLPREDVKSGKSLGAFNRVLAGVSSIEAGSEFATSKDAMKQLTTMMTGFGMKGSQEDILSLGTTARGAFKNTKMQGSDLSAFAKESASFAGFGVKMDDALSTFATANEAVGNAEHTAVGMRNYLQRNADTTPERQREIESMGMAPSQLSVEKGGTTLDQSLAALEKGLSGKTEEEKNTALTRLYGESATVVRSLMARRARGNEVEATMGDRGEFMAAGDEFAGLEVSQRRRRLLSTETSRAEKVWDQGGVTFDENRELQAQRFSAERVEAGRDAFGQSQVSARETLAGLQTTVAEKAGLDPRDEKKVGDTVASALWAAPGGQMMLSLLGQLVGNTDKGRNRNGNVEPVGAN